MPRKTKIEPIALPRLPAGVLDLFDKEPKTASNQRNGTGAKTVYTDDGPLRLESPRFS